MSWPSRSLIINISEAVWHHLDRMKHKAASIHRRLLNFLQEAWRIIPEDHLKKLQESCPREFRLC